MSNRLLQRDIGRDESFYAEISAGAKEGYTTYTFDGSPARDYPDEIQLKKNTVRVVYTDFSVNTVTHHIKLNLDQTPLILIWFLGSKTFSKNLGISYDRRSFLLTSSSFALTPYTYCSTYWDKNEITIELNTTSAAGDPNGIYAFFKYAVYDDDTQMKVYGF